MAALTPEECREVREFCARKANEAGTAIYWTVDAIDAGADAFTAVIDGRYKFQAGDVGSDIKVLGAREVNAASQAVQLGKGAAWDGTFDNQELKNIGAYCQNIQWVRDRI